MKNLIHGLNVLTTIAAMQLPYLAAHGQNFDKAALEALSRPLIQDPRVSMPEKPRDDAAKRKKMEKLRLLQEMHSGSLKVKIFEGGIGTGGGDFASQEVRSIVSDLPSILVSKGLQYFPEVDIDELEKKSKSFLEVKIVGGILVQESPKAMFFNQKERLILVDSDEWNEIGDDESGKLKKQALVFHEVLGLMGLEKNNDYSISNRLLGLHFLQALNILKFSNQIIPRDHLNPQVIYWRTSSAGRTTIFHCLDRKVVSSCRMLGNRSYTKSELQQAFSDLKTKHIKEIQDLKGDRKAWKIATFTLVAIAVVIIAIINAPVTALLAYVGTSVQAVGAFSTLFSFGAGLGWMKTNDKIAARQSIQAEKESVAQRITEQKPGSAEYENFDLYARNLHEFLINQSPVASDSVATTKP